MRPPDPPPVVTEPSSKTVVEWVYRQLQRMASESALTHYLVLSELNAEPEKPAEGMIVRADGTNWNPGAGGAGVYVYIGATWTKL